MNKINIQGVTGLKRLREENMGVQVKGIMNLQTIRYIRKIWCDCHGQLQGDWLPNNHTKGGRKHSYKKQIVHNGEKKVKIMWS